MHKIYEIDNKIQIELYRCAITWMVDLSMLTCIVSLKALEHRQSTVHEQNKIK